MVPAGVSRDADRGIEPDVEVAMIDGDELQREKRRRAIRQTLLLIGVGLALWLCSSEAYVTVLFGG